MGIFVAIPTEGEIRIETALCMLKMLAEMGAECELAYQIDRPVDRCRNVLANRFLNSQYEQLLFLDSDIVPPFGFWKKLAAIKAGIVGATCIIQMQGKLTTNAFRFLEDTGKYECLAALPVDQGPITVDALGMGCALIQREVFEKVEQPWFEFASGETRWGEDINFCRKARRVGFECVIEPSLFCEHIRTAHLGQAYLQVYGKQ